MRLLFFFFQLRRHNAELVEHTVPLRDLKLLVGSGGLDFTKAMDSLDKQSQKSVFGSASHLENIGS